ncbi:MAG: TonB-dependent receptor [bacterium]
MKRFYVLLLSSLLVVGAVAQNRIKGVVQFKETGTPIEGVSVSLTSSGKPVFTSRNGSFVIVTNESGDELSLVFTGGSIQTLYLPIRVTSDFTDLGVVSVVYDNSATIVDDAMLIMTETEFDTEGSSQSISGLLASNGDVFSSTAGYVFGTMRFRVRGLEGQYNSMYINGVLVNNAEKGWFSYSQVGGLNDMLRTRETVNGTESSSFTFGNLGGAQNINARASAIRKGLKVSQVASNSSYNWRTMATYATGLMDNGWALAASGSWRKGESGYVEGTYYDAYAFSVAAEKVIDNDNSISLTVMGAPTTRGKQAGATQEAYDLTPSRNIFGMLTGGLGNNYYNPNWGYQNGVVRNAKEVKAFTPIAIASHIWEIDEMSKLTTSFGYKCQMDGSTSLNWYNSADPRPNYYRNLPNYYYTMGDESSYTNAAAVREELWTTSESYRQINWDNLYATNYLANANGLSGRYMVENQREDQHVFTLNSVLNYKIDDQWKFDGGVEMQSTLANHYKIVDDLLGAEYWLDIDQYGERDNPSDSDFMQNDLNNPDRQVTVGDRFGYDYDIYANSAKLWGQATYSANNFDAYFSAQAEYSNFWRDGNMLNGRASEDMKQYTTFNGMAYSTSWLQTINGSYGASAVQHFLTYATKAGINYRISGRHILALNVAGGTNAPYANDAFFSQRIKNNLIPDLTPEGYISADLSYYFRTPRVNGRLTLYNTNFFNSKETSSFYNDEYNTYVNFAMYDFSKRYTGMEFGMEVDIIGGFSMSGVAALGQNVYTSNATATISYENGLEADTEETININGFHISGTPEVAASVGFHYFHSKYWFFDLNVNYFTNSYMSFNPLRRTDSAIAGLDPTDETDAALIDRITAQEKLSGGFTVDASIGKSINFNYKYFLNINLSAKNILNNNSLITGGYEQSRFSTTNSYTDRETYLDRFPSVYYYAYGTTFYLNIGFRF